MITDLAGASVWEAQLCEHLASHESSERELLEEYREAAGMSGAAAFAYLAEVIVADEVRHHRLFRDLADSLRHDVELRSEQPTIPRVDGWGPDPAQVARLSDKLLERERRDQRMLRHLHKELSDVADTTLWDILVRLMELDTEKHIEILEFVRKNARRAAR